MQKERRKAERLDIRLSLELRLPGMLNAALGESINISSNGVYFRTEYFMGEGTRLPMSIELRRKDEEASQIIRPECVVVRCLPEEDDKSCKEYQVACFFMEMEEQDRKELEKFISSVL